MKAFNLKRALAGEPVVTRDGRPVKIAGYNEEAEEDEFCLLGWANNMNHGWHSDGTYMRGVENGKDLFMAPTERKEWIVRVVSNDGFISLNGPYTIKVLAEDACVRLFSQSNTTIHEITIIE